MPRSKNRFDEKTSIILHAGHGWKQKAPTSKGRWIHRSGRPHGFETKRKPKINQRETEGNQNETKRKPKKTKG